MKHELCCIGHITHDKIVTPKSTAHMPGGTAFYFSKAMNCFTDIDYALLTAVGEADMSVVEDLRREGVAVDVMPSPSSVYFENIYGDNPDNRTQRVLSKANPFTLDFVREVEADIFHLGSLLADDFPKEVVEYLAGKSLVSADSQGYLREVRDKDVFAVDWPEKHEVLRHVHFLKANEHEMEVLTGFTDAEKAARELHSWGVKEVLLTFGSMGSIIFDGKKFHTIPAYVPREVADATGCGDTYMTGYLYRRAKNDSIDEAGRFAAAMSTLKIEKMGPFQGTEEMVRRCMEKAEQKHI